jgi:hypothetical protein
VMWCEASCLTSITHITSITFITVSDAFITSKRRSRAVLIHALVFFDLNRCMRDSEALVQYRLRLT